MVINLIYIFFILAGLYFGVITYMETRKREVLVIVLLFILSLYLEMDRLNQADYKLNLNDFLWTTRDIVWTIAMVFTFQCVRKNFPYQHPARSSSKKRLPKKSK